MYTPRSASTVILTQELSHSLTPPWRDHACVAVIPLLSMSGSIAGCVEVSYPACQLEILEPDAM